MRQLSVFLILLMTGCVFSRSPRVANFLTLKQRYEREAMLNPLKQCSYTMLLRTWNFTAEKFYKPLTHKKLFEGALKGLNGQLREYLKMPQFKTDIEYNSKAFWKILVREKNREKKDLSKLCFASLHGMARNLNERFTKFLDVDRAEKFVNFLSGDSYEGIGVNFHISKKPRQKILVSKVQKDSPAERAGVKEKDEVISIGRQKMADLKIEHVSDYRKVTDLTQGKAGTSVSMTVKRKGEKKPKTVKMIQGKLKYSPAECKLLGRIVYCRISRFSSSLLSRFGETLKKLSKNHEKKVIIDLRNNPGGIIDATVLFLAKGWYSKKFVAVNIRFREGTSEIGGTGGQAVFKDYKTVVLINNGSASGSEVVSGALRDHKTAILIGTRSYGKGTVQEYIFPLGAFIKVTKAEYRTPLNGVIDRYGLKPDIFVKQDLASGRDLQLERAIKYLKTGK